MEIEWITTTAAAQITGYHVEYIRILIRRGDIEAKKFGTIWQVRKNSLLFYLKKAEEMGDRRHGPKNP